MNALVAFGAALLALRLAGLLARRWRATRRPELAAWAWALAAYAIAAAAIAWGEAVGRPRLPRILRERRAPHCSAPRSRLAPARGRSPRGHARAPLCRPRNRDRSRAACTRGVRAARTPARAGSPRVRPGPTARD